MTRAVSITDNIIEVRSQIEQAAVLAGRRLTEITLIAVTKTIAPLQVAEAIAAGVTDFGENRVQEALPKVIAFPQVNWHLLGHLQRNKVKDVIGKFKLIHSVDSIKLAQMLTGPVLIEVNTSGEATKYGVTPEGLFPLLQVVSGFANIQVVGLMTIAPMVTDSEQARPYFSRLRELSFKVRELHLPNVKMSYLSMGMSDDFVAAIKEGANLVRIGRAIFGKRS